jgi:hypothetical protein
MSYLRLPTEQSLGKANMAMGAIGAGIDLANGRTTTGVLGKSGNGRGKIIQFIPGTKLPISGLKIPYWDKMLEMAIQAQEAANLGFLAVDFLIDRDIGPVIVELTARPGLSIQIANQDGMRWRLRKAAGLKVLSVKQGIRLAKDLFGGEIEDRIETISGKNIIGLFEDISLFGENGNEIKTKAKIDTGADTTSIDKRLASKLGFEEIVEAFSDEEKKNISDEKFGEEMLKNLKEKFIEKFEKLEDVQLVRSSHGFSIRPVVNIKIKLGDTILDTRANIFNREHLTYKVIVGRKSLSRFLIEPSKLKNE